MNFTDLQEKCWEFLGLFDTGNRLDWRRQMIRDALNMTLDEVVQAAPYFWALSRESTISLVSGTAVYALNDWCSRPLSFWTVDQAAHKVIFRNPRIADRDASRNTSASYGSLGPYHLTWSPRSSTAAKSGTSATATEASTTVTKSGGPDFTTADIGRMLRLNGEDMDYKISAVGGVSTLTVDKPIKSRLTGLGSTGVGAGYAAVSWEIGPVGRFQIQILPTPTSSRDLNYRYYEFPRRMMSNSDLPGIMVEWHHLLWKGALRWINSVNEDDAGYSRFLNEYKEAVDLLRKRDLDDVDGEDTPFYDSIMFQAPRGMPVDTSFRDGWRM